MSSRTSTAETSPDELVPDPEVCREFKICSMTLSRWSGDPKLSFPPAIKIKTRNYRSRRQLEAFKEQLLRTAIAAAKRSKPPPAKGREGSTRRSA